KCLVRAAFIEGGENFGKSYLLACVLPEVTSPARMVIIDLAKNRAKLNPIDILLYIASRIDVCYFPELDAAVKDIASRQPVSATVSNVTVNGSYNNIQAIAQDNEEDRLYVAIKITESFLEDLRKITNHFQPIIIAIDGYEAASTLIDR